MEKVTISRLKSRLSAFLKKVQAGQTIVVFDRDRPVARIEPVGAGVEPEGRIARLERAGIVRPARGRLQRGALRPPGPGSERSVVEALLDERRESR